MVSLHVGSARSTFEMEPLDFSPPVYLRIPDSSSSVPPTTTTTAANGNGASSQLLIEPYNIFSQSTQPINNGSVYLMKCEINYNNDSKRIDLVALSQSGNVFVGNIDGASMKPKVR